MARRAWTDEENDFLRKSYASSTIKDMSLLLSRTENSVRARAGRLSLTSGFNRRKWKKEEDLYLIKNFGLHTEEKISKHLKRTIFSVNHRVKKLRSKGVISLRRRKFSTRIR